ncbi:MAG: pilus assembly protein PilZ [Treponema sp.]|jgi:hypothetical protein|nr:pilus assembly protein PilZ [Treponema sp.]
MTESHETAGRQIFFLYPSALIENQIVKELVHLDFEVYIVRDIEGFVTLLKKHPRPVILINLDEGLREKEWQKQIQTITGDAEIVSPEIGVFTANGDNAARGFYQKKLGLRCGYITINSDCVVPVKQLLETFKTLDVKGGRKYLNLNVENEHITVNMPMYGGYINGIVRDLSVKGFSCTFEKAPLIQKNALLQDLQIKLQGQLLKAEGIALGVCREGNQRRHLIVFTQRINPEVKTKIRLFIQQTLQEKLNAELALIVKEERARLYMPV